MADLSQTPANVKTHETKLSSALFALVQAGETITAGQPVREDTSTKKHYKAQATTQLGAVAVGIALTPAVINGYFLIQKGKSFMDVGATLTVGTQYAVSNTAGAIRPLSEITSGQYPTYLGTATAADKLSMSIHAPGAVIP